MLKWEQVRDDTHRARCGHLYVRVEEPDPSGREPADPETSQCAWFVEPDDEDKSYRRALASGHEPTVDAAKTSAAKACRELIVAMIASI